MNGERLLAKDAGKPARGVRALLFADVRGFTKMDERECVRFFRTFHKGVQENVLSGHSRNILLQNTWGDALHAVVDDIAEAGRIALDLQDWMRETDWAGHGLAHPPTLRVGLHAGVVTRVEDPIIRGFNYIGRNTSKAARIEPIAFEGQVFASGAYAALLELENPPDLVLEYAGVKTLPKGAGDLPVFMLARRMGTP